MGIVEEERPAAALLLPALLAGLVAAIVGGVAWGLIVKWTDYEVGFVAWGIGLLVGIAVATATRGVRGPLFQVVAVLCALLGILLGKYLSFAWVLQEVAEEETQGVVEIAVLSMDTIDLFFDELGTVFDWIDILWVGLAVYTAWRALQPEPEPAPEPEPEPPSQQE
jgi:xanthosine utilization system XapX-like protein